MSNNYPGYVSYLIVTLMMFFGNFCFAEKMEDYPCLTDKAMDTIVKSANGVFTGSAYGNYALDSLQIEIDNAEFGIRHADQVVKIKGVYAEDTTRAFDFRLGDITDANLAKAMQKLSSEIDRGIWAKCRRELKTDEKEYRLYPKKLGLLFYLIHIIIIFAFVSFFIHRRQKKTSEEGHSSSNHPRQ